MELLKKEENISSYSLMHDELVGYISSRSPIARNSRELKQIKKFTKSPYFENESFALSNGAKSHYFNARFFYFRFIGDTDGAYEACRSYVDYLHKNESIILQSLVGYRTILNNFLVSQIESGRLSAFLETLELLRSLPEKYNRGNNLDFVVGTKLRVYEKQLQYIIKIAEPETAYSLISEIEKWLLTTKVSNDSGFETNVYNSIGIIYFMGGMYKDSLRWLNKIFNYSADELNEIKDIYSLSRIIEMLICFETKNPELLESIIRSTKRYLSKEDMFYKIENEITSFFKKTELHFDNQTLEINQFKLLKTKLVRLSKKPLERSFIENFDFVAWIDSHLQGRPFVNVARDRFQANTRKVIK